MFSQKDRERLRFLARRQMEYAASKENEAILKKWQALAEGRSTVSPMARLADCRVLCVDVGIRNFAGHAQVLNRRVQTGRRI